MTNSASLAVNQNVSISGVPASVINCLGTSASFSVSATGAGLGYQWYKGNTALVGQTDNGLTLNNVSASDAGTYSVVVSGACGNPVTNSASLTVNQNVSVSSAPVSLIKCPGTSASFSVSATGTGLSYQWCKFGTALPGQTNSSLTLNNVSGSDTAIYRVIMNGVCGSPVTNSAGLTVNQNVSVSSAPVSLTNCAGTSASFSVSATGTGLSYQWYKAGSALTGQTSSTLTLNNVSANDAATYSVIVSGVCGNPVTNSAGLTVLDGISISPLTNRTNTLSSTATFSTIASGSGPFSYRWTKDSTVILGQTNNLLT